eukprot:Phypoly_transcript_13407.p1 GENE.Phypoly_transcript_13407~~Phypoly_transcript_13407.p1  ORF type:complete len:282 (+),score=59.07 Phypoly_transcript_13407:100-945(+)
MSDNFGMMDAAYFVGRNELLNWLNDLLSLGYTKVEQTASGAAHCQIMDAIYPGKVPLHKVNFNAKFDYEYVKNFKVLQEVFGKLNIEKYIDVQKLIKGKYQDNLEFLQWIKRYYDLHFPGGKYNAIERRAQSKCPYEGDSKASADQNTAPSAPVTHKPAAKTEAAPKKASTKPTTTPATSKASSVLKPVNRALDGYDNHKPKFSSSEEDERKINELTKKVTELKVNVDSLEKERDFYFGKLREVEVLAQNAEKSAFVDQVLAILYASDDENFAAADEVTEA